MAAAHRYIPEKQLPCAESKKGLKAHLEIREKQLCGFHNISVSGSISYSWILWTIPLEFQTSILHFHLSE